MSDDAEMTAAPSPSLERRATSVTVDGKKPPPQRKLTLAGAPFFVCPDCLLSVFSSFSYIYILPPPRRRLNET